MKALTTIAIAFSTVALVGCASTTTAPQPGSPAGNVMNSGLSNLSSNLGSILLTAPAQETRSIQYVGSDINAARVSIFDADTNTLVAQASFTGTALATHLNQATHAFSFTVENLKANDGAHPNGFTYNAKVETFLDTALTTVIGNSTSGNFNISASTLTTVAMPSLTLNATPVGSATASVTIVDNAPAAVVIK